MSANWIVLPVFMPLLTACLTACVYRSRLLSSIVSCAGAAAAVWVALMILSNVLISDTQVTALGGWQAPFGIVFVADALAASLIVITAIIGMAVTIYSCADLRRRKSYPLYHVMIHILLAGVAGSFLTGDVFNLYVWFEVMLIAAFGLMVLDAEKPQIDAAIKYAVLNLVSTMVLLLAIGLLYGATGTLNMADLHGKIQQVPQSTQTVVAGLFFFGFAIKASFFPLYSWLPASYSFLPSAVVALFAALLTKVGVYAMLRLFTLVFAVDQSGYQDTMIVVAALTMLMGVLGAASQYHIKKILSFHIISQIGYMLMGLAIYTPLAISGTIFYIIHHIVVKANLFLIGGYIERRYGSDNLAHMGGLFKAFPLLGFLFLIPAFSLAGFPPLSGFWGKFLVIKASLQTEYYLLAATALFVGLLTIFSMTKIWGQAFWKPAPEHVKQQPINKVDSLLYLSPVFALGLITILIGLFAESFYQVASQASNDLLNPQGYVSAVLAESAARVEP